MLSWLPTPAADFKERIAQLRAVPPSERLAGLQLLADHDLDASQTRRVALEIDDVRKQLGDVPAAGFLDVRLLVLAEWTADHIIPALTVAALRRQMLVDVELGAYGQLHQTLAQFDGRARPRFVVFLLDGERRLEAASAGDAEATRALAEAQLAEIDRLRRQTAEQLEATPIFHTIPPVHAGLFGAHEAAIGAGPAAATRIINASLSDAAKRGEMLIFDLDGVAQEIGTQCLIDPRLWRHAKMMVAPDAASLVADRLAALLGAALGRSRKVLVLDLDNTLWGGVIGDDGVEGITLGQGSGSGESFVAFQKYLKRLKDRGIVLAVSSKNDHEICTAGMQRHPEMVLKLEDFSCFRANWDNKADNIVQIAKTLNLGLESFVFVDDNPAERALIRRELPMVAVPELPEDPALYIDCLARAHYFDAIAISAEDKQRTQQYLSEEKRRIAAADARDLKGFLNSLEMKILVNGYRNVDLIRIAQLINKTNQFNLTTRRYTESQVRSLAASDDNIILSARVEDRFGDNGLISVVIAKRRPDDSDFVVDTWLMSCRVLGRNVEQALMKTLVGVAQARGARQLHGVYLPTSKNKMVENFYANQGFSRANKPNGPDGATWWDLDLGTYSPPNIHGTLEVKLDA